MSSASARPTLPSSLRLKVVLVFYLVAAALLPLAHHDLACHLKSSTHCVTCAVGSSGETAGDAGSLLAVSLDRTGDNGATDISSRASAPALVRSGRAPPSVA